MAPVPVGRGLFGLRYEKQQVEIDDALLTDIANATGGRYFRARDPAALQRITEQIDALERAPVRSRTYVRYTELFRWPLCAHADRPRGGAAARRVEGAAAMTPTSSLDVVEQPWLLVTGASCCRSSFVLLLRRARRAAPRAACAAGHDRRRARLVPPTVFSASGGWRAARLGRPRCSPASRSPVRDGAWSARRCVDAASISCSPSTRRSRCSRRTSGRTDWSG